jgi:hypothetical protein
VVIWTLIQQLVADPAAAVMLDTGCFGGMLCHAAVAPSAYLTP